jgi:WD40 repeat protein
MKRTNNLESSDERDQDIRTILPALATSHQVIIKAHGKICCALGMETSGTRFACGSMNSTVKIYNFSSINREFAAFQQFRPHEGHIIKAISFSPTGEYLLVVDSGPQAKIYNREGIELSEFVRGDMYIHDSRNTSGHTSGLVSGQWHPLDSNSCLTSSEDGTLRLWDTLHSIQKMVIKPHSSKSGRLAVSSCCYNTDGQHIAACLANGSLQFWDLRGKIGVKATACTVPAPSRQMIESKNWRYLSNHGQTSEHCYHSTDSATGMVFSSDNTMLATRGNHGTLRIWDLRNLHNELKIFKGLPNCYANTQVSLSPNENFFITGTSVTETGKKGIRFGGLCFINRQRLEIVKTLGIGSSAIQLTWHPKLNQILVAGGDQTSGFVKVFYDPICSKKGAMIPHNKSFFEKDSKGWNEPCNIFAPFASIDGQYRVSKNMFLEISLAKNMKKHKPDPGMSSSNPGRGGRIGTSQSSLLTQHLLKKANGGEIGAVLRQDPREVFLNRATGVIKNLTYTAAYKMTQPSSIFSNFKT